MVVNVDFEAHITDAGQDIVWNSGRNKPVQPWTEKVLRTVYYQFPANSPEESAILSITNFDDARANHFLMALEKSSKIDLEKIDSGFYCIGPNKYIIFGQEFATKDGHITAVGLNSGEQIIYDKNGDTVELIKRLKGDHGAIVLAANELGGKSLPAKLLNKFANKQSADISSTKKFILNNYDNGLIDGVKASSLVSSGGIPIYAGSDSHTPKGVFSSYREYIGLEDFHLISKENLIRGLKERLSFNKFGENNLYETLRHGAAVVGIHLGMKSGLLKRIEEKE